MPALLLTAFIATSTILLASPGRGVAGDVHEYEVMRGDSLALIGARFGVAPAVLARDNGLEANATLHPGDRLEIDNRHIVPVGIDDGIVVNLPQRRLFLFRSGSLVESYPVAVGEPGWRTPQGEFSVRLKEVDPSWEVPKSIQAEMAREGKKVLTRVAPGPDNPLGTRWIEIAPKIGIHGTSAPSSIFRYATHGCIRMSNEDVERLFELVQEGDPVSVIYEPVLVARSGGGFFVEVHGDPYGMGRASRQRVAATLAELGAAGLAAHPDLDRILQARDGRAVMLREPTAPDTGGAADRR